MKTITIDVTQHDINTGVHSSYTMCPIALAVKRADPGLTDVYVTEWTAAGKRTTARKEQIWVKGFMPKEAGDFIHNFDFRKPVSPFQFQLTLAYAVEEA